jgi:hypothetical protein
MTIAIGVINQKKTQPTGSSGFRLLSSIWMASDSQATYGATKRENPNKINVVDFVNGQILVAQADNVELGDKTIEKLRAKAKQIIMDTPETAINAVRSAMREVRLELLEWNKECVLDYEKFFWSEHRLNLLVGYFFNEKPYLYKMDIYRGLPAAVKSFEAIGGGEILGYFLLKEYAQADPDFEFGMPIAISVVDKVIDNVDGCGKPTWVGNVFPVPDRILVDGPNGVKSNYQCFASMATQADTEMISKELKIADVHRATLRKKDIVALMKRASKKHLRNFLKQQTNPERFLQMRYSPELAEAVKAFMAYISKNGNSESKKLAKEFRAELGKVNNKPVLNSIWKNLCESCPAILDMSDVCSEIGRFI